MPFEDSILNMDLITNKLNVTAVNRKFNVHDKKQYILLKFIKISNLKDSTSIE